MYISVNSYTMHMCTRGTVNSAGQLSDKTLYTQSLSSKCASTGSLVMLPRLVTSVTLITDTHKSQTDNILSIHDKSHCPLTHRVGGN